MRRSKSPLSISVTDVMAVDYETTGFATYKGDKPFSGSISNEDGEFEILRFDWTDFRGVQNLEKFTFVINHPNIIKVAHNAKYELSVSKVLLGKIPTKGMWRDTILMSQVLQNLRPSHKLEVLANRFFQREFPKECRRWKYYDDQVKTHMTKQKRLMNDDKKKGRNRWEEEILKPMRDVGIEPYVIDRPNYGLIPVHIMDGYQQADAERGIWLHEYLWPEIVDDVNRLKAYNMEMEMVYVAQEMEESGFMLHRENAEAMEQDLVIKVEKAIADKKKIFGYDINLDSPPQMKKAMFDGFPFEYEPVAYTDTGAPSLNKHALNKMIEQNQGDPVFEVIQRWRAYSKGLTNVRRYQELAGTDGIIHCDINTNQARTTRQSVSNPSLQNVSKEVSIHAAYAIPARRCFRPRPGYILFLGDYAGIELRLFIAESGEEILIQKFKDDPLFDAHSWNASIIYGKEFDNATGAVRKALRARIKDAVFGLAYGSQLPTWARSIGKSLKEAKVCYERYKEVCPKICNFNRDMAMQARSVGFVTTSFGRRINVPREEAYKASNYRIQGTAAEILKRGEIAISEYTHAHWGQDYLRQLLSVHDENIMQMHRSILDYRNEILQDLTWCMIDMPEVPVPLEVEWNQATTCWGVKKDIDIDMRLAA